MYDLVLKEGMWHEIAFSEGKRRRSFFQVAVSGEEICGLGFFYLFLFSV